MNKMEIANHMKWPLISGLLIGLIAMVLTVSLSVAAPLNKNIQQQPTPASEPGQVITNTAACAKCHPDVANRWVISPHAHAYDDPNFQDRWVGLGQPGECLGCHTTNYERTSKTFAAPGVACEGCHGRVDANHPPSTVPIKANPDYCGSCHTTTLSEWRLTGHARAGIGCTDCHDPHSQKPLFTNPDDLCINCHKNSMKPYLETIHGQKGIGCVACHRLVIPPAIPPKDGIVPTGHTFTITPETCVACHTDALHAGFSLPGYENGAKVKQTITETQQTSTQYLQNQNARTPEQQVLTLQTQLQALEASLANRNLTTLFQGAVVGLVLGGSTAWVVASNLRRGRREEEDEGEDEDGSGKEKS